MNSVTEPNFFCQTARLTVTLIPCPTFIQTRRNSSHRWSVLLFEIPLMPQSPSQIQSFTLLCMLISIGKFVLVEEPLPA
jgi:hypothetical protein